MKRQDRGTDEGQSAQAEDASVRARPAAKGGATRDERLKAALRANLQRRKTQIRARRTTEEPG